MWIEDQPTQAERKHLLRRQRRKKILRIAAVAAVVLAIGYFTARPVVHALKAWQARRHARKAFALIEKQNWLEAREQAVAAFQLRATEPQAVRAVARVLSGIGQQEALEFWERLAKLEPLSSEDLRDEARVALRTGDTVVAKSAVDQLTNAKSPAPADWLLAAQLAAQTGSPEQAGAALQKVVADPHATPRELLDASLLQLAVSAHEQDSTAATTEAWKRIEQIGKSGDDAGLDALVFLARAVLSRGSGVAAPVAISETDLAEAIDHHALAKTAHKLIAADLRIRADPEQREKLVATAAAQFHNGDLQSLEALAGWLNSKGEFQRELEAIPAERAMQDRELFLQHVDALAGLGRWADVRDLLERKAGPIDPVIQFMYLARCTAQLGETTATENNWQRALEAAAGDPAKLMVLGSYAEKNGTNDVAAQAYDGAIAAAPKLRQPREARLRLAYAAHDTPRVHAILADMLKLWPDDTAVQNDDAYTRLLLLGGTGSVPSSKTADNPEIAAIEQLAAKLVAAEPASLAHRTLLALARLRLGQPARALEVYSNVSVPKNVATPSALAVHAAVLAANGRREDAATEMRDVAAERLLPEEAALIQNITP